MVLRDKAEQGMVWWDKADKSNSKDGKNNLDLGNNFSEANNFEDFFPVSKQSTTERQAQQPFFHVISCCSGAPCQMSMANECLVQSREVLRQQQQAT